MKIIIGAYRGLELAQRALDSIWEHAVGVTGITIIDDSGGQNWDSIFSSSGTLSAFPGAALPAIEVVPKVVVLPRVGYTRAMQAVCRAAGGERFMFWEEDFIATEDFDLEEMATVLVAEPKLAQLALLRQPFFPNEIAAGSLLAGLQRRLPDTVMVEREVAGIDIIEQDGTFTCNPAVWQSGITSQGWPSGKWSEDRMRDRLAQQGFRFGFLPGERVHHDGKRSGFGY
jgi:hypothetical protein